MAYGFIYLAIFLFAWVDMCLSARPASSYFSSSNFSGFAIVVYIRALGSLVDISKRKNTQLLFLFRVLIATRLTIHISIPHHPRPLSSRFVDHRLFSSFKTEPHSTQEEQSLRVKSVSWKQATVFADPSARVPFANSKLGQPLAPVSILC